MNLILWRHAEAEDADARGDMERALTKRGRKQAERMGEWLRARIPADALVLASPARRAVQTAKALGTDFQEREALGTDASVASILREAGWPHSERSVVVVGHQPTLGAVAATLLGARKEMPFRKGAIWWFAYRNDTAVLCAVIEPEMLER